VLLYFLDVEFWSVEFPRFFFVDIAPMEGVLILASSKENFPGDYLKGPVTDFILMNLHLPIRKGLIQ
jgi:hypothetical protein